MIVDGERLLTGGRNVGDKYFGINSKNYIDLDLLLKGDVAKVARENFFLVWNSGLAEINRIVTPYLIPTDNMLRAFKRLRDRGVRIRILTYSLHSTDNPLAQAGYYYKRRELVKLGVELHEFKGPHTMHAKTAVIDGWRGQSMLTAKDGKEYNLYWQFLSDGKILRTYQVSLYRIIMPLIINQL